MPTTYITVMLKITKSAITPWIKESQALNFSARMEKRVLWEPVLKLDDGRGTAHFWWTAISQKLLNQFEPNLVCEVILLLLLRTMEMGGINE